MIKTSGRLFTSFLFTGLSGRLLVLTAVFVLIAEVVIYLPSVARFRQVYLHDKVERAYLALQVMKVDPDMMVTQDVEREVLRAAGVRAITVRREGMVVMAINGGDPVMPNRSIDLRESSATVLMVEAVRTILGGYPDYIEVLEAGPQPMEDIQVIVGSKPLRTAMIDYSKRIAGLSLVISLLTGALVFLALQRMTVRPVHRLIGAMKYFRRSPENVRGLIPVSGRRDELGEAEQELRVLQQELQEALRQKERLAGVGQGVSKIAHDLRNTLATAQLLGERLVDSADPDVRAVAPRLTETLERALTLCTETMQYGQARESAPRIQPVPLATLVDEVALACGAPERVICSIDIDLIVFADREQLYRVLFNLTRNAFDAMGPKNPDSQDVGHVTIAAENTDRLSIITVTDEGPGFAPKALENLFKPFVGSARRGGTGLGLVICQDLIRAHGGTIDLHASSSEGTVFEIRLPIKA